VAHDEEPARVSASLPVLFLRVSPRDYDSGGNGQVPHYSGTTLDAQLRYASGTKSILENYLQGKPQGWSIQLCK
jgi:hypothetical protein